MMLFPVVRVQTRAGARNVFIPLDKIEMIMLNDRPDAPDVILLNGKWYECEGGAFGICDYFAEELMKDDAEQIEPREIPGAEEWRDAFKAITEPKCQKCKRWSPIKRQCAITECAYEPIPII